MKTLKQRKNETDMDYAHRMLSTWLSSNTESSEIAESLGDNKDHKELKYQLGDIIRVAEGCIKVINIIEHETSKLDQAV